MDSLAHSALNHPIFFAFLGAVIGGLAIWVARYMGPILLVLMIVLAVAILLMISLFATVAGGIAWIIAWVAAPIVGRVQAWRARRNAAATRERIREKLSRKASA